MTELPAPLTSPDCDLRGYDFMPLFGHRLFRSDLYEQTNGEEFKVAVKLWWEAWNQCPAGSLPDDDHKLARLADLGRDVKGWRRMREAVLRGFILCSDGRLYHKALSEWATEAYERRVRDRQRKRKWRSERRDGDGDNPPVSRGQDPKNDGDNEEIPRSVTVPEDVTSLARGEERTGEDRRGEESKKDNLSLFVRNSREPVDGETPAEALAVEAAIAGVAQGVVRDLHPTGAWHDARQPIRDAQDQIAAVEPPKRPKSSHISADHLAALRQTSRRTS